MTDDTPRDPLTRSALERLLDGAPAADILQEVYEAGRLDATRPSGDAALRADYEAALGELAGLYAERDELRAALATPSSAPDVDGLDAEGARKLGIVQGEQNAVPVLARIVAAAGGEVRVPDNLMTSDVTMHTDWENGVTVYRATLASLPDREGSASPTPSSAPDVEGLAHKAAEIGFTYGALGRDYEYVHKNVNDMLAAALRDSRS